MGRRGRALVFLLLAIAAAGAAAAIAEGYGSRVTGGYGPLRPVVVLDSSLPAGTRLDSGRAGDVLTVRRVPERFIPPGALAAPAEAAGLVAASRLSGGSYLQASQLRAPGEGRRRARRSATAEGRSRSRSAAPTRCSSAAPGRPGRRWT